MPFPVILSSPSGGGKTTIAHQLLATRLDVGYSVSCTTRPPREGEVDGRDYHFTSVDAFRRGQGAGEFAESAEVHGHLYGTLRAEVERVLSAGKHVIMDIDVQGTRQFAAAFPQSVLIFVLPPSADILVERLEARGTEDTKSLITRFRSAKDELKAVDLYPYVILNEDLDTAVQEVSTIIDAESLRRFRSVSIDRRVSDLMKGIESAIDKYSKR